MYKIFFKRIIDIFSSFIGIVCFLPIFIVVSYKIRKNLGRPIIFSQNRPGKNGKIFKMYKFRTMLDAKDKEGNILPDSERLTDFGKKLRSTSLDELPELFNVLKGDMSLVGPRPLLVEYLELYTKEQARRHDLRPGITGWAQVNGRNAISWDEKFRLDIEYVEKYSFLLDIKILLLTIKKVFVREGISQNGEATVEKFKG